MTTIIVLSDVHGDVTGRLNDTVDVMRMSDKIIFAGDGYATLINFMNKNNIPLTKLIAVKGNCDTYTCGLSEELVAKIENVNIYLTHGNALSVRSGTELLEEFSRMKNCTLAIYGHTHIYDYKKRLGVTVLNSGAIEGCRDKNEYTYALMTIDGANITVVKMYCKP